MKHRLLVISVLFAFLGTGCSFFENIGKKEIKTAEDFLELMGPKASGDYRLTSDIDLGGMTINKEEDTNGSYIKIIGNGHKISNATITSSYNASFFGYIGSGSSFTDITFDNITVIGKNPAIIASTMNGGDLINVVINENCNIGDGTSDNAGGLVGVADSGCSFEKCINKGSVTGLSSVGGIVGESNGQVSECVNYGEVTGYGEKNVGGVAGVAGHKVSNCAFKNNTNYGKVSSNTADHVGGVAGVFENNVKTDYYEAVFDGNKNYGNVSGVNSVGGVAGYACPHYWTGSLLGSTPPNCVLVTNSTNSGTVIGKKHVAGVVGETRGDFSTSKGNKYCTTYSFCSNLLNDKKDNYIQGEYCVGGISGSGALFKNCNNSVSIQLAKSSNSDMLNKSTEYKQYQFGVGGIAGWLNESYPCEFSVCNNTGNIQGYKENSNSPYSLASSVGGIVGLCYGGSFINNTNQGTYNGQNCIGGIIGSLLPKHATSISNPKFTGTLVGYSNMGGIIGYFETKNNYNSAVNVSNANINMSDVIVLGSMLGGYVGNAYTESELDNKYYEKLNIINSKSTYTYYKSTTGNAGFIRSDVGFNDISNTNKRVVVLDESSQQNATCTLLGEINY